MGQVLHCTSSGILESNTFTFFHVPCSFSLETFVFMTAAVENPASNKYNVANEVKFPLRLAASNYDLLILKRQLVPSFFSTFVSSVLTSRQLSKILFLHNCKFRQSFSSNRILNPCELFYIIFLEVFSKLVDNFYKVLFKNRFHVPQKSN